MGLDLTKERRRSVLGAFGVITRDVSAGDKLDAIRVLGEAISQQIVT